MADVLTDVKRSARIWLYCRDVDFNSASLTSIQVACNGTPLTALKHWAIILDYMSIRDPNRVNKRILYEALNTNGILVARHVQHGEDEEEEWKQKRGFTKQDLGMVNVIEDRAKAYCEEFNKYEIKYIATKDNCQRFVDEFLANVLPDSAIGLPVKVQEAKPWVSSSSEMISRSISSVGSAALVKELLLKACQDSMLKEAIKNISLHGIGTISFLSASPFKEFMANEGKKIILSAFGETIENWLNASRGAFSWFNLLQFPVELIVNLLMKNKGFTDLQAYGGKKLASCFVAIGSGLLAGGPLGCLVSVAVWLACEILATLIKCLLAKMFGESFTSKFGESETLNLIKSIYGFFAMKIKAGLDASLKWMLDYMESSQ